MPTPPNFEIRGGDFGLEPVLKEEMATGDPTVTFQSDPEGLWATPLCPTQRLAITSAFREDRELRREVENLLRGLGGELRPAFVRTFAHHLVEPPTGARPVGAVMPALEATIGVANSGHTRETSRTRRERDK